MRRSSVGVLVVVLVVFTGCNSKSTPGGPGATSSTAHKPVYGQAVDTFSLSVPTLATTYALTARTCRKRGENRMQD
jgi:hypothetical protein